MIGLLSLLALARRQQQQACLYAKAILRAFATAIWMHMARSNTSYMLQACIALMLASTTPWMQL